MEPGIVVIRSEHRPDGGYRVTGLRDPDAADPNTILDEFNMDRARVAGNWESYYSLHPDLVLKRSQRLMAPPDTVTLTLKNNILGAEGTASRAWIANFKARATAIAGVSGFDDSKLSNAGPAEFDRVVSAMQNRVIFFDKGKIHPILGQEDTLDGLARDIKRLVLLSRDLNRLFLVRIKGHTDRGGTVKTNMKISRARAETVSGLLVERGIDPDLLIPIGKGADEPMRDELTESDRAFNRCVSIVLDEPGVRPR